MKYKVYMHTLNGKSYIGQTCKDISIRVGFNFNGYKQSTYFYSAIQKYGSENVKTEILYSGLSLEEANRFESLCIYRYNTLAPNGYNLYTGGLNHTISNITREKMSQSRIGHKRTAEVCQRLSKSKSGKNNPFYGKKLSKEHRNKVSKNNARYWKGKRLSKETRQKISKALTGKKLSVETRKKVSENSARYWQGKKIPKEIIEKRTKTRLRNNALRKGEILNEDN